MLCADDDQSNWRRYLQEIKADNDRFYRFFPSKPPGELRLDYLRCNEGIANDYFTLYSCREQLAFYVYCYEKYQRCSDSKWRFWREVFLVDPYNDHVTGTHLNFKKCPRHRECFIKLSPYYWDNITLEEYLEDRISKEPNDIEAIELKEKLHSAKSGEEKKGMFAYKQNFNEEGATWDENTWSRRLCGCMQNHVVHSSYLVKYTADQGNVIYNKKQFYNRFHGAPDLTIQKSNNEGDVAVLASAKGHDDDDSDSQGSDVATLENSTKIESRYEDKRLKMTILEKTGELLSNMHILLVKKMVKRLELMEIPNLEVSGILISRPTGIVICSYEMPIVELEDYLYSTKGAKLTLKSNVNALQAENICVSVWDLLSSG